MKWNSKTALCISCNTCVLWLQDTIFLHLISLQSPLWEGDRVENCRRTYINGTVSSSQFSWPPKCLPIITVHPFQALTCTGGKLQKNLLKRHRIKRLVFKLPKVLPSKHYSTFFKRSPLLSGRGYPWLGSRRLICYCPPPVLNGHLKRDQLKKTNKQNKKLRTVFQV